MGANNPLILSFRVLDSLNVDFITPGEYCFLHLKINIDFFSPFNALKAKLPS